MLFVQVNTVPATCPLNVIGAVIVPLHKVCGGFEAKTSGVGLMLKLKFVVVPGQPLFEGNTVISAVRGENDVSTAENEAMSPVPDPPIPILPLLLVQLNTVPGTELVKISASVGVPLQMVWSPTDAVTSDSGFTVPAAVAVQPVGNVYIIVTPPTVTPLTSPVTGSTVATEVLLLLHVPGVEASLRNTVLPRQKFNEPVIGDGNGFTVTAIDPVFTQPFASVPVIL